MGTTRACDGVRLAQCVACTKDPRFCGCTESDEDKRGLCKEYESIFERRKYDEGRNRE